MPLNLDALNFSYDADRTTNEYAVDNNIDTDIVEHSEGEEKTNSADDILGMPYARNKPGRPDRSEKNFDGMPDNMEFGTEDVARSLGLSAQTVRNYADEFEDILLIRKKDKGQRRFTTESIERFRKILELKDSHGFTNEQVKDFIRNGGKKEVLTDAERIEQITDNLKEGIENAFKQILQEMHSNHQALLEDQSNRYSEVISALEDKISSQQQMISEISEAINKEQSEKDLMLEKLNELSAQNSKKDEEIQKLRQLAEKQIEELGQIKKQTEKKKRFGIF